MRRSVIVPDAAELTPSAPGEGQAVAPPAVVPTMSGRLRTSMRWIGGALALPLALYLVLRPENYSLTPNSLDPVFYTGYSINFDDIINAVGDTRYFVTRWSAYYPMYVADAVLGPIAGRLVWRWALASVMAAGLWAYGRRFQWTWAQRFLVAVVVLTMPMFVRAFMTDYVEYIVVSLGLCLWLLCLQQRQTWWSGATIGTLVALILVANPVAVVTVSFALVAALVLCSGGIRQRIVLVVSSSVAAAIVVLGGFVLFRWQYGIPNVYKPTIDFVRTYGGDPGAWKSPRYEWLARFTWLYGPPILLVTALVLGRRRKVTWHRTEIAALALLGVQYVNQWYEQFPRDGFGLELSFYWSFAFPAYGAALVIVVAKFTQGVQSIRVVAIGVGWLLLLWLGVPAALQFPPGVWFALVAAGVVAGCALLASRRVELAVAGLLALLAWTQIGAPDYDPSAYFKLNVSPNYDMVFRHGGDLSEVIFDEAIWFEREMDRIENDASTSFVAAGGWSSSISGLYAPHVTGRLAALDPAGDRVSDVTLREIKAGFRPVVAVFGEPALVGPIVANLEAELTVEHLLLDVTHDTDLGYRLVVFQMPDWTRLPFTWTGDALEHAVGGTEGRQAVAAAPDDAGFLTFGPYISIPTGRYTLEYTYSSSAPVGEEIGFVDANELRDGPKATRALLGTGGTTQTVELTFDSTDPRWVWEFRTNWNGTGRLSLSSITLAPAAPAEASP